VVKLECHSAFFRFGCNRLTIASFIYA
jgi:hypothetical protein